MKKPLLSLICLFISSTSLANCRSLYEQDLAHRLQSHGRLTKIKKISKRSTFAAVGGAVGVHFYLLFQGQLIASALLGASVGGLAVLPVGVTFFAVSEVQEHKIKNRLRVLDIIQSGKELDHLLKKLQLQHLNLTKEKLMSEVQRLNSEQSLCNGVVSQKRRLLASPREVYDYLDEHLETSR